MAHTEKLPQAQELMYLSAIEEQFPMTRHDILGSSSAKGMDSKVMEFIKLFPADRIFDSFADFITQCEELIAIIRQKGDTPYEALRGPEE